MMIATEFIESFMQANKRLKQPLTASHLETAIRYLASKPANTCMSIQPGHSGYAWSERKVVMVFLWNTGTQIRMRFTKRVSFRNSEVMPGSFKEMRAFPLGNAMQKLVAWSAANDGTLVELEIIKPIKKLPSDFFNEDSEINGSVFFHLWAF
jgi:hypothetical protein